MEYYNGGVEFDYGDFTYVVEFTATIDYDAGDNWTPPVCDWDIIEDQLYISQFDDDGKEKYLSVDDVDKEFLLYLYTEIGNDVEEYINLM
jgi:hypothetical protein